jgi:hypothetical protein
MSPEAGVQHVVEKVQHGAAHSNISQRDPLPNLETNINNNAPLAENKSSTVFFYRTQVSTKIEERRKNKKNPPPQY